MVVNVNHHNMGDDENRSRLFDEIKNFSQRKLKQVQTKVTTGSGEHVTEKRSPKGVDAIKNEGVKGPGYVVDTKPDLQVGMIIPGLFIASQDVAQDRTLLNQYEITHILNLAYGVENAFEDDFNYKKLDILDVPETDITQYFDECFDFIDEGIHQRNCLVHCNAGVSRSTAICCAYLMKKQKMKYKDALALVREARAFARPNDGFAKQLEDYDDKIFGQFEAPDPNEDAFIAKKRAEREAEKAAILGTVSVKNRLNKFGAQLESVYANRLQDAQPVKLPLKRKPAATATTTAQQQSAPPPKRTSSIKSKTAGPPPPPPPPNFNAPAPPPPPPPPSNVKAPPPPPVAKKAVSNKAVTPLAKEPEKPRKVITNKTAVATPKPVESVPEEYQKSENPNVDETAITVAAQRKLWESAMQANPLNNGNHVSVPKVQTTPATPNNVNKSKFSWQQSQAPTANAAPSPEPEKKSKKIILKQRKDSVTPAEEPRRSTRDLVEALEAVSASNSQSPSPYSSPAQPRRQLQYGRRAQTSQIGDSKPQQQPVPKAKPTWGLRETVDSLADSSGSPQTTPRCRSPLTNSISSTPRQSHSPSPSRNSADSDASCASTSRPKVFGRVPPRKVSLSGNAANSNSTSSNHSNEFPVVPSAPSVSSAKSAAPTPLSSSVTASSNTSSATKTREPRKSKLAVYESCQPASSKEVEKVSQPASQPASAKPSSQLASAKPSNQPDSAKASSQPTSAKPSNQPVIPEPSVSSTASDEPTDGLRTGFKKVPLGETKQKSTNRSVEARRNRSGLNRSSTAEILKLIKTKSRADFGRSMETVDEDIEIDYLLNELEKEGLDAIDWDLIGVNEDEVKNIVETNRVTDGDDNGIEDGESSEESSESSEEESSSEESSDEEEEMQHTVFASPATTSSTQAASSSSNGQPAAPVKHTSAAVIKLAPPKPQPQPKLEVEEEEEESSEEEESEEETEEETDSD